MAAPLPQAGRPAPDLAMQHPRTAGLLGLQLALMGTGERVQMGSFYWRW